MNFYDAAVKRLQHGHNDTCDYAKFNHWECTCGHQDLKEALEEYAKQQIEYYKDENEQ